MPMSEKGRDCWKSEIWKPLLDCVWSGSTDQSKCWIWNFGQIRELLKIAMKSLEKRDEIRGGERENYAGEDAWNRRRTAMKYAPERESRQNSWLKSRLRRWNMQGRGRWLETEIRWHETRSVNLCRYGRTKYRGNKIRGESQGLW